jgi:hypothetical protein
VPDNLSGDFTVKLKMPTADFEVKEPETKFTVGK